MSDGDTRPGFRRRSSRPPVIDELPVPLIDPPNRVALESIQRHVAELHNDVRSLRAEVISRQESAREAIYRLQATVEGLRTSQDHAFQMLRDAQRKDRWVIAIVAFGILVWLIARSYRVVGV